MASDGAGAAAAAARALSRTSIVAGHLGAGLQGLQDGVCQRGYLAVTREAPGALHGGRRPVLGRTEAAAPVNDAGRELENHPPGLVRGQALREIVTEPVTPALGADGVSLDRTARGGHGPGLVGMLPRGDADSSGQRLARDRLGLDGRRHRP